MRDNIRDAFWMSVETKQQACRKPEQVSYKIGETVDKNELGMTPSVDGFTPHEQFFIGFAQVWCENTDASAKVLATVDPQSPGQFRTNETLQKSKAFADASSCTNTDKMVSKKACHVC